MKRNGGVHSFDMWVKKKDDWERDIPGGPRSVMSIFRLKDGTKITRIARGVSKMQKLDGYGEEQRWAQVVGRVTLDEETLQVIENKGVGF